MWYASLIHDGKAPALDRDRSFEVDLDGPAIVNTTECRWRWPRPPLRRRRPATITGVRVRETVTGHEWTTDLDPAPVRVRRGDTFLFEPGSIRLEVLPS
jgi:hypothetical protein